MKTLETWIRTTFGVMYKRNYIIEGWSYLLLSHHCVVYTTQNVTQAIEEENF